MIKLEYKPIIGLEVHVELKTESKMFCSCRANYFGALPNTQTCPTCLGLPGSLPFPNKRAIEQVVMLGLAFGCQINQFSKFDRKNYFYPDLPKGYQISQYDLPLAKNGLSGLEGKEKNVRIRRIHLEEDTGKLIHQTGQTLIDFNRSGVPLVEIVTEPDISDSGEARAFLQKLQQLIRFMGVSEADMEKGQMRCEPNVNLEITEEGVKYYTPIAEIKNINSFRFVEKAISFEIQRQRAEFSENRLVKASGNKFTRGWDESKQETVPQRQKEEAEEYRYFPEPDIPPLVLSDEEIEELRKNIPELPDKKKQRLIDSYGLRNYIASVLTITSSQAAYFEEVVGLLRNRGIEPPQIANLMVNKRIDWEKLSPQSFADEVLKSTRKEKLPESKIEKVLDQVLMENQNAVGEFKKGKTQILEFLLGQVAKKTQGKIDPNKVREALRKKIG